MPERKDDLEAVRNVVEALEGFDQNEQERIIRWAKEKIGLADAAPKISNGDTKYDEPLLPPRDRTDIRTFVAAKDPKNDQHFAATIAYYYRFEAPGDQRKEEITGADLQEACRQANRTRMQNPGQTLRNAHQRGLLNKGSGTGAYSINAVGENLVAMTLPLSGGSFPQPRTSAKKPVNKSGNSGAKAAPKKKVTAPKKPSKKS